ncbi:MAG: hypothetical protein KIG36_00490 [Eubacteriales bacterium]|nr:hypothetical protein [Eubacteriales bacterium]
MRKILASVLIVLLVAGAAACAPQHEATETIRGGAPLKGVNIRTVSVDDGGITVGFVTGSEKMGMEETAITGVPSYEIRHLDTPSRLVIVVSGVMYRDYESKVYRSMVVNGLTVRQFFDDPNTYIYVNIAGNYTYTCRESNGQLRIDVKVVPGEEPEKYYVIADAIGIYDEYAASEVESLTPTLTSDGLHAVLISKPFDTQTAAEAEQERLKEIYGEKIHISAYTVVKLKENALPAYDPESEIRFLREKKLYIMSGTEHTGTLMFTEARYVSSPESGKFFVSVPFMEDGELKEKLVLKDLTGNGKPVTDRAFLSVAAVLVSPSGRYIAIGEQADTMMVLSVLDTETGSIRVTGEEGMGTYSTGFAWDKNRDVLYSASGEGSFDLKSYDAATGEIATLAESYFGRVEVLDDGRIAYMAAFGGSTHLMLLSPNGTSVSVGACSDYQIASDGSFAVLRLNNPEDERMEDLKYVNIGTDETFMIAERLEDLSRFFLCKGNRFVVYGVGEDSQETEFNIAVHCFDLTARTDKKLLNAVSEDCSLYEDGKCVLNYIYSAGEKAFPVVYMLDIDWEG